ncbi:MAG: Rrf2 family transcriptional regulator [Planctomycetota bacterium]
MAVSQTADYALRAVVWLAHAWSPQGGTPQTAPQLAEATGVPASYLPKVLQPLIRSGIAAGQRGLHGGYSLQCDPAELSVWDVLQCVDPAPTTPERPSPNETANPSVPPPSVPGLVALDRLLHNVLDDEQRRFAQTPIASLLNGNHAA